jgi:hypothetical protein
LFGLRPLGLTICSLYVCVSQSVSHSVSQSVSHSVYHDVSLVLEVSSNDRSSDRAPRVLIRIESLPQVLRVIEISGPYLPH